MKLRLLLLWQADITNCIFSGGGFAFPPFS